MTSFSLRSRLLLVTVGLVALGLAAASVATYVLLSSQLIRRVDAQLRGVRDLAVHTLFEGGGGGFPGPPGGRLEGGSELPVTYAGVLDASGKTVALQPFGFGSEKSPPVLPAGLPGSTANQSPAPTRVFSAGARDGSIRYRVMATSLGNGTVFVAYPLTEVDATLRRLLLVEGLVSALVLGAAAGLASWLVRLGFRPLAHMEHAAADIAAGDLSRRVDHADDRTEVGRLGRALNAMMEKIEAAFAERRASEEKLRRFVADASHELRTPLTSIRGYAELFRHGADARPEDLAKSMRRIEEESTRMGELVEEMLDLARLDQGRMLDLGPVDVSKLAEDAVEDARVIQPSRTIEFERHSPLVVIGDESRLRQVAANLLSNALVHTPERASVRVVVAQSEGRAILEVVDDGPGLDREHAAKVFERFYRTDAARTRESGGAGLGLAIVSSIVQAHGGEVSLYTSLGRGARFVVSLPLMNPQPPA